MKIIIFILLCLNSNIVFSSEIGIDIYGRSYHYKNLFEKNIQNYNETNPGIGLRYTFYNLEQTFFSLHLGGYQDSLRNETKYFAINWQYSLFSFFSVGLALTYFDTESYRLNMAPLPNASFRFHNIALNFIWFPDPKEPCIAISITFFLFSV